MKEKQILNKSQKLKSKLKPNLKQKKTKDPIISNNYFTNYDSKKNSDILQLSIKRSKNQNKFNSTKKQSENLHSSIIKFGSSDISPKIELMKKKQRISKLNQIKNLQEKYNKSKTPNKTNRQIFKTDNIKYIKDNNTNKVKSKKRRKSNYINDTSFNLQKIKLNSNTNKNDKITNYFLNKQKNPDQSEMSLNISNKYKKKKIQQKSTHKKEIKSELKHLKKSKLKKSHQIQNNLKINTNLQQSSIEKSININSNSIKDKYFQDQKNNYSDKKQNNIRSLERYQQGDILSRNSIKTNSLKKKSQQINLKDSDKISDPTPLVFLKIKY